MSSTQERTKRRSASPFNEASFPPPGPFAQPAEIQHRGEPMEVQTWPHGVDFNTAVRSCWRRYHPAGWSTRVDEIEPAPDGRLRTRMTRSRSCD